MREIPGLPSNGILHPNGTPNKDGAPALRVESIEEQLARILNSQAFSTSARLKEFLEFTIRQHLSGNGDALKEYSLALEVFKKPVSYDPAVDSTVRSAAVRLRAKLRTYYETEGRDDSILIEYPGGHYAPHFSLRTPPANDAPGAPEPVGGSTGGKTAAAFGAPGLNGNSHLSTAALQNEAVIGESAPAATPRRRAWRNAIAAFVLGLSLAAIAYRWAAHTPAPSRNAPRKSVAVLGFQNLSNAAGNAWLSPAFAEMFRADLSAGEKVRMISGYETARAKVELDLRDTESLPKQALARLLRNLGAELVVTGSYVELGGGEIWLDIHLQDAAAGETIATVSRRGTEDRLFDLVSSTGTELRAKLGIQAVAGAENSSFRSSIPSNLSALRLYSEGVEKLRRFEATDARDLLSKAAALDPAYPLVHSAVAEAWSALGYDENAKKEAAKALELSTGLPPRIALTDRRPPCSIVSTSGSPASLLN
jgi:tetratricopeptide (TPR) repeat protein